MRIRRFVSLFTAALALPFAAAGAQSAQTGTIVGTVARDSSGNMVGQAQLQIPALHLTTTTNWLGEFQFSDVPAGRYAISVRAVGFRSLVDSITLKPGARVDADIILVALPVTLAAEKTTAEQRLPVGLQEMEDRRKFNVGGYFLTDSLLRANNDKQLVSILATVPSINPVFSTSGSGIFLANSKLPGDGGPVMNDSHKSDGTFPAGKCYVNVFVDGNPYFLGPAGPGNPPPDFSTLWAHEYSGIEFYPGGTSMPAEFNGSGKSRCGALLLWTRRTP